VDPSRPESPAEAEARRIREAAARRRQPTDRSGGDSHGVVALAGALRSLPPGWSQVGVVGGVVGGEDPARVVVGPGGVAVVQAFSPTGPVTLERGEVLEAGVPSTAAAGVLAATAAVRDLAGPASRWTTAVLCAAGDVAVLRGAVVVCSTADLVRVLTGAPVVLAPGEVAGTGIRLAAALRPSRSAAGPTASSRLPTAVTVVAALLLLVALLLLAPRLAGGLGTALGH
jgi:hypothetical protein